jgi:cytochrome c
MELRLGRRLLLGSGLSLAAAFALSLPFNAHAFDENAAKATAKRNDCFKCHAVDKTKKGPSYKKIAAKLKGKPDAEQVIMKNLFEEPEVKMEDGTKEKHKVIDTKDKAELKNLMDWILAQ